MKRKPRIAVIGLKGLPAFGGAASVGENIIEHLKDDFEFVVLSISSHTLKNNIQLNGYKQIVFNNFGNGGLNTLFYYIKSLFHCLFNNYDLVHLHHAESGFITPFLRLRYKVVCTFHGLYRQDDPKFSKLQNMFFRFSEKWNVKFASMVVSVSKPDQEYIFTKYGKQINYIPNGISVDNSILSKEMDEKYIFFAAGRIYQIKGLHFLLKAMQQTGYKTKIIVAGDLNQVGSYKEKIEALAKGMNIDFIGLVKEKQALMRWVKNADFFVFPSTTEAMSMMLLEVVSMKTPIIASNIPGNTAIFSDKEILFFESENSTDLSEKLKFAFENPDDMEEKAAKAFEKLNANYTWKIASSRYKEIYYSI